MIIFQKITKAFLPFLTVLLLCNCVYAGSAVNRYNDMAPPFSEETEAVISSGLQRSYDTLAPSYSFPVILTVIGIGVLLFALVIGLGIIGRSRR